MTDEKNLSTFEEGSEDFAAMFAAQEAGTVRLQPGQKVTGTIITITGDSVFVDVGIKLDGIMDRKDILDAEGNESVAPGDSIEVYVVGTSAGEIRLSRSMSGAGMAALEDARDAGVPVDGRVTGTCKGGYTVSVRGKNAFCPGSQMDSVSVADAEALVGRTMQFLIIRVENRGRNIVVSRRALLDRERQENLEKVLASLNVGDTVEGRITRLASFGAFMELAPGVEGMIHLSELSWSRVNSADEAVAVGDMVRAKLLSVSKDDKGRTRISLSRKKAEGDPWLQAADRLAAVPGTRASSAISCAVNYYATSKLMFTAAPGSFYPAPKVTSAVVRMDIRPTPAVQVEDEAGYFALVRAAFGQRRKTAANAIAGGLNLPKEKVIAAIESAGFDARIRPEALTLEDFAKIQQALG